ncbi:MAG: NADH-ubiquinone oxidoreductase-F iron-sulfur binding region domain-containing protein, partial [Dehalococcoidales bacterium]|nr:NADH-ubiquinone oxidoreductase-F iron-sulfur binding region domain-containing protein [Dehalococcoidales bacterium]
IQSHLIEGKPVSRLFYHNSLTGEAIPYYKDIDFYRKQKRVILHNCGHINPERIEDYIAASGYKALRQVISEMSPLQVITEVKNACLRGRGGAGFSTGRKWEICRNAPGRTKYIICNADEGDPGTFVDRTILESDPHSILEGMVIASYAIGARYGYIYVRAEYPLAVRRVRTAIRQAKKLNLLGKNILGSKFSFDIRVFEGAGAFVCGEATALIASIEGRPGIPRYRPPHLATKGLHGKPTLLNNVKTFAYIRHIIERGAEWFAGIGTKGSTGTAVFALAGKVVNTGLVEVPMGTTLREIIFDIGGGIAPAYLKKTGLDGNTVDIKRIKNFKAVQIGGPSGGCLPESALDLPVDFDSLTKAGAMMGSGGMIVLDEDDCMVELARYFIEFTQKESCGKCTFCRLGTKQMLLLLTNFTKGLGNIEDLEKLEDLALDIKAGSLCGLGKSAPNPVLSTLRYFRGEYETHIKDKRCPALYCGELVINYADDVLHSIENKCTQCKLCSENCDVLEDLLPFSPGDVAERTLNRDIDEASRRYLLRCSLCNLCVNFCPQNLPIPQMVTAARRVMLDTGMTDYDIYRIMWVDYDWNAITLFRDTYQLNFDSLKKEKCDTLFMPGCSLANESPQLVFTTFNWLADQEEGEVGILLYCCGMPLFEMGLTDRGEQYEDLFWKRIKETGAKKIVVACPNCFNQVLIRGLKEGIKVISLLELMVEKDLKAPVIKDRRITVHDSCPSRHNGMPKIARQILEDFEIVEMLHNCENTICCGSGGVVSMVDPELHDNRAAKRIEEFKDTRADICVTYCMACCNTLSKADNKGNVKHILELIFDQSVDHSQYQAMVRAMWEGEWGTYNDYRLRNSKLMDEFNGHSEVIN